MERIQVDQLVTHFATRSGKGTVKLIETHISWIILTPKFAYKIKRPVSFSFVDFSNLERRKHFCQRELELNQRLTQDIYLAVIPIIEEKHSLKLGEGKGNIVEYAVMMKRLDEQRQMDLLLKDDQVDFSHIDQLVDKLSDFHAHTEVVEKPLSLAELQNDFSDILTIKNFIVEKIGGPTGIFLQDAVGKSSLLLSLFEDRFCERHQMGFTIDAHGDLHSKNIFLLDEPVVFDCLEFNDHFRQIDILNELAFFCMDLEFYGRKDLESYFLQKYLIAYPCLFGELDLMIFEYYKFYRANVKVKVNAIKALQAKDLKVMDYRLGLVNRYLLLLKQYDASLSAWLASVKPAGAT